MATYFVKYTDSDHNGILSIPVDDGDHIEIASGEHPIDSAKWDLIKGNSTVKKMVTDSIIAVKDDSGAVVESLSIDSLGEEEAKELIKRTAEISLLKRLKDKEQGNESRSGVVRAANDQITAMSDLDGSLKGLTEQEMQTIAENMAKILRGEKVQPLDEDAPNSEEEISSEDKVSTEEEDTTDSSHDLGKIDIQSMTVDEASKLIEEIDDIKMLEFLRGTEANRTDREARSTLIAVIDDQIKSLNS